MNDEPAFPINGGVHENQYNGMGLRDYFAAKAMQGIVSILDGQGGEPLFDAIAHDSYTMADAMMKERIR